ncbi:hypothetical protein [Pseudaminobacter soli (ex Li et al. 2025)]|uniref:hypothetical protein n=1 Tax=Pseudaminobacter soli (ex Li et al. 2025) TaxID=1295366 RepID=UPI0015E6B57B|nr:hypothetical protein [Mesorhizobium soli]
MTEFVPFFSVKTRSSALALPAETKPAAAKTAANFQKPIIFPCSRPEIEPDGYMLTLREYNVNGGDKTLCDRGICFRRQVIRNLWEELIRWWS